MRDRVEDPIVEEKNADYINATNDPAMGGSEMG